MRCLDQWSFTLFAARRAPAKQPTPCGVVEAINAAVLGSYVEIDITAI
jgi:hypothetical protein